MEKSNKVSLILLIILTVSVVLLCVYKVVYNQKNENLDGIKFMEEYSELNGKVNENTEKSYVEVEIDEKNLVKYLTEKEAVELLDKGTGVIYFGFSTCPWCRSLVTSLVNISNQKNEVIYYLDVLNVRSKYEVKDGVLNKVKDGSENYYKILNLLDKKLENYILTDKDNKNYDTGEKRLYAPTIVAVKNGVITGFHVGTVDTQLSGYDKLNDDEVKALEKIITNLINSKNVELCTTEKC